MLAALHGVKLRVRSPGEGGGRTDGVLPLQVAP